MSGKASHAGGSAADKPRARLAYVPLALALAGAGLALCVYLLIQRSTGAELAFCAAGSSCDVVQQSRWSTLLGIPLPLLGVGLYTLLAGLIWRARTHVHTWANAWAVSFYGLALSLYYTLAVGFELDAYCTWCLASLAILFALTVVLTLVRPKSEPSAWRVLLPRAVFPALAIAAVLHMHYSGWFNPAHGPEKPYLRALAEHLDGSGAKFYGAYWCPHCNDQKDLFEASAPRLPYVECSPAGRNGPLATACAAARINGYPTWIIGDRRFGKVLSVRSLARYSGFKWDGPIPDLGSKD